jgi:acetoin utilization protein AcuB
MFYVSNVSGSQIPYDPETFQVPRTTTQPLTSVPEAQNVDLENSAEEALAYEPAPASSTPGTRTDAGKGSTHPSAQAVGLAGASAIHRSKESTSGSATASKDTPADFNRDHDTELSTINPTHEVEVESHDENKKKQSAPRFVNPYDKIDSPRPRREPALRAEQIMSSPIVSIRPDQTMGEAWRIITNKRYRHLPVATQEGKLVGIVSDRNFIASTSERLLGSSKSPLANKRVSEVMATSVLSARPNTPIRDIARVMFEERIGAMPIVDENEILIGLLTRSDILRVVVNRAPLELWT